MLKLILFKSKVLIFFESWALEKVLYNKVSLPMMNKISFFFKEYKYS